ncbi:MAG: SpoIIE family protein phosphatase, partial [Candidatus Eremiobacteraeota bacterium]|nr:SpoIIE family protein phosphatase [Candidatus Eremiobacteraeota bacterium]
MTLRNVEAYEHERRVAESFQRAALPVRLPSSESVRFDAHYEAGRSEALVGGDWYDAVELMGGRVLVSIGDVSGSGLAAAVTMGLVRQSIRAAAQAVPDPAAILEAADRALRAENPDHIVTAFVGIFDVCTNDFWYASAGHPPALLRQPDGTVEELRTPGPPLGLRRRRHAASSETTRLLPDSLVVLYTDGLIEATRDILAGERQLREALADPALLDNAAPAEALRRILLPGGSHDDVAILTIRTRDQTLSAGTGLPSRAWRFASADAAAAAEARREFNELLRETPFDPGQLESAELIFGEMVGNAVKHTSGDIEARLSWTGASPVLHVLDEGPGYGHLGANPPNAL